MKKRFLKYSLIVIIFLLLMVPNQVLASSEYTIQKYDIDMVVNEDNTFDITETITAYFYVPKHRNI